MGDREVRDKNEEGTDFRVLEEPWAVLHASVLQTIWEERARTRSGIDARDVGVLWQITKQRFARDAQDHLRNIMLQREYLGSRVRSATPARRGRRYLYSAIQALRERTGRAGWPDSEVGE